MYIYLLENIEKKGIDIKVKDLMEICRLANRYNDIKDKCINVDSINTGKIAAKYIGLY